MVERIGSTAELPRETTKRLRLTAELVWETVERVPSMEILPVKTEMQVWLKGQAKCEEGLKKGLQHVFYGTINSVGKRTTERIIWEQ